jgi:hypothetical protein
MDPQYLKAQVDVQERFDILPKEIMEIITGGLMEAVVIGIANTYSLSQEQADALENEIILVLSFFIPRNEFVQNVTESLGVDPVIAQAIGAEVESNIFELVEDVFLEVAESTEAQIRMSLEETADKKTDLQKLAESFAEKSKRAQMSAPSDVAPVPTTISSTPEVATQTVVREAVTPLRTMKDDVNRIHGYGAYNEARENDENVVRSNQNNILRKE